MADDLYLHCGGWHMRADAKTDGALLIGEAYPAAWKKINLETNGHPTHWIWVTDSAKQEHPVRCVLPLQGDESQPVRDRVVATLENVSLQLHGEPVVKLLTLPPETPIELAAEQPNSVESDI